MCSSKPPSPPKVPPLPEPAKLMDEGQKRLRTDSRRRALAAQGMAGTNTTAGKLGAGPMPTVVGR